MSVYYVYVTRMSTGTPFVSILQYSIYTIENENKCNAAVHVAQEEPSTYK